MRLPRAETLLPIAIVAGALALATSEFMIAFEFTPPGGEPLRDVTAADRHGYSSLILAIGALVALGIAIATGARPAAFALAGIGGVALLLFLIIDLPDAGQLGDLSDPLRGIASARAEAQPGFWLQAVGALTLALAGGAFATFKPSQLQAWKGRLDRHRSDREKDETTSEAGSDASQGPSRRTATPGSTSRSKPYDGSTDRASSGDRPTDGGGRDEGKGASKPAGANSDSTEPKRSGRRRGKLAGLRRR